MKLSSLRLYRRKGSKEQCSYLCTYKTAEIVTWILIKLGPSPIIKTSLHPWQLKESCCHLVVHRQGSKLLWESPIKMLFRTNSLLLHQYASFTPKHEEAAFVSIPHTIFRSNKFKATKENEWKDSSPQVKLATRKVICSSRKMIQMFLLQKFLREHEELNVIQLYAP